MAAILSRRAMLSPPTTSVGGPIEFLYPTGRQRGPAGPSLRTLDFDHAAPTDEPPPAAVPA